MVETNASQKEVDFPKSQETRQVTFQSSTFTTIGSPSASAATSNEVSTPALMELVAPAKANGSEISTAESKSTVSFASDVGQDSYINTQHETQHETTAQQTGSVTQQSTATDLVSDGKMQKDTSQLKTVSMQQEDATQGIAVELVNNAMQQGVATELVNCAMQQGVANQLVTNAVQQGVATELVGDAVQRGVATHVVNDAVQQGVAAEVVTNALQQGIASELVKSACESGVASELVASAVSAAENQVQTGRHSTSTTVWLQESQSSVTSSATSPEVVHLSPQPPSTPITPVALTLPPVPAARSRSLAQVPQIQLTAASMDESEMVELLANKVELLANDQQSDGGGEGGAFLTGTEADVTPANLARRLSPSPEVLQKAMVDALSKDG